MPGWTVSGTFVPKRLREDRSLLPRMFHRDSPGRKPVGEHRLKQLRPGGRERISRLVAQRFLQGRGRGQGHSVLADEAAEAAAVTFVPQRAGQQREVDAAPGFVPGAKRAGGHILLYALLGAARGTPVPNRESCPRRWWPGGSPSRAR